MASKNKTAGRLWEAEVVSLMAGHWNLIPYSGTNIHEMQIARAEQVDIPLDNRGVDIWFSPTLPEHMKQYHIQCKKTLSTGKKSKAIDVQPLFDMQTDKIPLLFTKIKYKPKGKNQILYGKTVTMKLEDFLNLIEK